MATEQSLITSPHYGEFVVDPREFTVLNGLSGNVMNFLKYTLRRKHSRLQDLSKAVESAEYEAALNNANPYFTMQVSVDAFLHLNKVDEADALIVKAFFAKEYEIAVNLLRDLILEVAGAKAPQAEFENEHMKHTDDPTFMMGDVRTGDTEEFYADQNKQAAPEEAAA